MDVVVCKRTKKKHLALSGTDNTLCIAATELNSKVGGFDPTWEELFLGIPVQKAVRVASCKACQKIAQGYLSPLKDPQTEVVCAVIKAL